MKKDIHPKVNNVIFLDTSSGEKFISLSTLTSKETETIDGVEYKVIKVETSSASHPFYTGKEKVTKTGRVEQFMKRKQLAEEKAAAAAAKAPKKSKSKVEVVSDEEMADAA